MGRRGSKREKGWTFVLEEKVIGGRKISISKNQSLKDELEKEWGVPGGIYLKHVESDLCATNSQIELTKINEEKE